MILCITPNPAVDRTLVVPQIRVGAIARATRSIVAAGGKGLNVARVAHTLGGTVTCAGFLGGHSGRLLADLAEQAGLAGAWTWIDGETRTCVIVVEPNGHDATVFNENGPPVTPSDWRRLHAQASEAAQSADVICLSGSLPPGSDPRDYADLLAALRPIGRPIWADTSGAALAAALTVAGIGIKVNGEEAGAILGAAGAVLAGAGGSWHAQPPPVRIISTVGSGDAFLAGLAVGLTQAAPPAEALRRAVAAGSANALSIGGGTIDRAQYDDLVARTTISVIA